MNIYSTITPIDSRIAASEKTRNETIENVKPSLHLKMDFSIGRDSSDLQGCLSAESMDCGSLDGSTDAGDTTITTAGYLSSKEDELQIVTPEQSIGNLDYFAQTLPLCIKLDAFLAAFDSFIPLIVDPSSKSKSNPFSISDRRQSALRVVCQNPTCSALHNIGLARLLEHAKNSLKINIINVLPPVSNRISKKSNRMSHLFAAIHDPSITLPDDNLDTVYHTNRYFTSINRWRQAHPSPQISETDSDPWEAFANSNTNSDTVSGGSSSVMSDGDIDDAENMTLNNHNNNNISDSDLMKLIQNQSQLTPNQWHRLQEMEIPGIVNITSEPCESVSPVVAHSSVDLSFCMQLIPVHHVENGFLSNLQLRYNELADGGILFVSQPSSLKFFNKTVLPCLDQALYNMLALNLVSSSFCEDMSSPPNYHSALPFEEQLKLVQTLPNSEVVYMKNITDFEFPTWSSQWLFYESDWLNSKLRYYGGSCVSTSSAPDSPLHSGYQGSMIPKLLQGMSRKKAWKQPGVTDISIFVIRKKTATATPHA